MVVQWKYYKWLMFIVELSPHSWGFLFVGWWVDLDMAQGRTLEEKIIIGLFFIGMLAWWGYNEYKQDKSDD